ncbi:Aconitate hydratase [Aquitalea magnusonii]|uniref:Aconitate hydratase n=1 Tax=Aquitalea magnusonii TaxID=332411 RepID=A0A3G9GG37_9NEIS|nr:aconitate hydratase AcnA [Aquitalea magnusonii]BBF85803.1 Aconitate hydratase [Aquitalea magnusonii]
MRSASYLREFSFGNGQIGLYYALPLLEQEGFGAISRLPVSLRIMLESLLRHVDGQYVSEAHLRQLAGWQPQAPRETEIPFVVARILLQDFTGVPLLCDLAAMRDATMRLGRDPLLITPKIPVHLVVDHSVQVDFFREPDALQRNLQLEYERNGERYRFIKWGQHAFANLHVTPPGQGIVHQVNLEYLAPGLSRQGKIYFPDTLVGTDSHTTMINGLGVLGWGVGGIEAESAMLGLPVFLLQPDVLGVHLHGQVSAGVTATDVVLTLTELLRKSDVVGDFVEFFGNGAARLTVPDRATIANMAPEYGATVAYFPPDHQTVAYLTATGRDGEQVAAFQAYFQAQQMFGMPRLGEIDYSRVINVNLADIKPCVAGPRRPQDRIPLDALQQSFLTTLSTPTEHGGFGKDAAAPARPAGPASGTPLAHGDIVIAAITSCTNTSHPGSMLTAGLLARKAVALGLKVPSHIKTSLAPGSQVVRDYLQSAGLLEPLAQLGFRLLAYGCTTCIGNSGPLDLTLEQQIVDDDLICAAVLSGNRNFEARIHPALRANFLMSPPLVVAFALAGRIDIDLTRAPLGHDAQGNAVYLSMLWPSPQEIERAVHAAENPARYPQLYQVADAPLWQELPLNTHKSYNWPLSSYIARPPFLDKVTLDSLPPVPAIRQARALLLLGDSVTTDHISPAGSIAPDSCAGGYLQQLGIPPRLFNSYGSRRGNHEVMVRGTFANIRIHNLMLAPAGDGSRVTGGYSLHQPDGTQGFIYDVAQRYQAEGVPLLVIAGKEYGSGSSRDWAAKGTALLGVRAVIAESFERIHRSNLVGMGVLPLQFQAGDSICTLGLTGRESFALEGLHSPLSPAQPVQLHINYPDGCHQVCTLQLRVDTPTEVAYCLHGGVLPYVLHQLLQA